MVSTVQTKEVNAQIEKMKRDSKKRFNGNLVGLIKNMRAVFPHDVGLATMEEKVNKSLSTPATSELPLLEFAKTISKCKTTPDIASMISTKDERVLLDPQLAVPLLQQIDIADKWKKLSAENKEIVWQLMQKLVELSMTYMTVLTATPDQLVAMFTEGMQDPEKACKLGEELQSRIVDKADQRMKTIREKKK